jgi:hypothetical protein
MTSDEFRVLVARTTDTDLLGLCLRDDRMPYVFEPEPESWNEFRAALSAELRIAVTDITVVGSARLGFSLRPDNNLKPFSDKSDIDVIVVNEQLFDRLWLDLLATAYPDEETSPRLGGWLKDRRREVYAGWLNPLEIKLDRTIWGTRAAPIYEFSSQWFNCFQKASQHPPRRHEAIEGRLYRTWRHAELYHLHSLGALRRSLPA